VEAGLSGCGRTVVEYELTFNSEVSDGWCVLVPAGTWHNVTNIGEEPMQVYTVYAPQHHRPGNVQATKAVADADTDDESAEWSVQTKMVEYQHV
jgi:mannose-6-phosphate isomerase-like protein (cupin superfamily)